MNRRGRIIFFKKYEESLTEAVTYRNRHARTCAPLHGHLPFANEPLCITVPSTLCNIVIFPFKNIWLFEITLY